MRRRSSARRGLALAFLLLGTLAAWSYARDMRKTPVIWPQKMALDSPDSSVYQGGGESEIPLDVAAKTLKNPVPADTGSVRRGQQAFVSFCSPCHGMRMDGKGPVAPKFMPPPDLMGKMTRDRSDGYIYRYVRFGGAVMPKYGYALPSSRVWDVVNYVRYMQGRTPR